MDLIYIGQYKENEKICGHEPHGITEERHDSQVDSVRIISRPGKHLIPEKVLQAFKAEVEESKDWFPRQGKVEMAIFHFILYVRGPMAFDPKAMANEQALNAHKNGISYSEIRAFFNSYPDMPLASPNRKTEYIRRRDKEFASWLDEHP